MSFKDFVSKFLFHVTLAATAWFVVVLVVERIIPSFVTPFVNLPFIGLVVGCLIAVQLRATSTPSRSSRILGGVMLLCIATFAGMFVWSRINDYGTSGMLLALSAGVLAGLTIYALTVESS